MRIYRAIKTAFDTMENQIGDAITRECIGTFDSEAKAQAAIDAAKEAFAAGGRTPYVGWDGATYPQYRIEPEEVL